LSDGLVRYRFLSVVGEGGFGKVYRARLETSEGFHKDVAVKVLSDKDPPKSLLQRFRDEAKILGLVRDRAIVGAEPPIKVGDRWAVVMEYIDGVSLGSLIAQQGIDPGVAVEIVGEAARALHNAFHMEGPDGPLQLLHRDIKPDNIQVTPNGDVRILDFGIARANFAAREFRTRHSLGGTPGYIAPERLQGVELPVGDVYSLGVVLHEAITGTRPKYPPTVQFEAAGSTMAFESTLDTTGVQVSDLEVPDEIRNDPNRMQVLRLAGWMRAEEPDDRPSARQVEDACRSLRSKLPPPYLREWAEQHVPHRNEIAPDAMIGQVLTTSMPSSVVVDPSITPLSIAARTPAPASHTPTLALGAVVGGVASALLVSVAAVAAVVVVGIIVVYQLRPVATEPTTQATVEPTPPEPAPSTDVTPPVAPAPAIAPPAPSRASPPRPSTEIVVEPKDPVPVPPAPTTPAPPVPKRGATGLVVVKTVPSGATVREKGKTLELTGTGYMLPIGMHRLEIQSSDGETTVIPVLVKKDYTHEICYDFSRNEACGAQ
jgi:serine/threonine-protein kinase